MNQTDMVKLICLREGKKSEVTIGNVREIVRIQKEIQAACDDTGEPGPAEIIKAGSKKYRKKKVTKKKLKKVKRSAKQ